MAQALWALAQSHCQQGPTFRTSLSYTRLTVAAALDRLCAQGFSEDCLPSPSTMAQVLNRNSYRLRKVVKAKPQKKLPETDAIFANITDKDGKPIADPACVEVGQVMRLSIDCKATVKIGEYSRGGKTRGDSQAADHDMGCEEKQVPFGIVQEYSGQLHLTFASSFKTSDFIVDGLEDWWQAIPREKQAVMTHIQLKVDNGPESSGVRTQFLKRMVEFADTTGKIIQLLSYPPYHSKYNPIERCWGILEQHWNGAQLVDTATMLAWAKSMTWKGSHPMVN
ncbi:ISAzo13-like element transposase-related protein [Nitrosomonas communis]|uniref:ISAzo13-like element transposase-related protein n=1 Tax=Nitrosomonas communis TaxID=44574 RepID=UPI003D281EE7